MSLFGTILQKLGLGRAEAAPRAPSSGPAQPAPPRPAPTTSPAGAPAPQQGPTAPPNRPVTTVDVAAQLEQKAAQNPQKLNWRTSIVDLLKLLDIDSSLAARKSLATELGCPTELMGDSAKMNVWLHKTVLARIAANGGKVPQDLLD
jgi:hypothetical protein